MSYTIISLFDGMSCGQVAINKLGLPYDKYYSSEVDKYAIQVTQHNYPNTIQVGDITKLRVRKFSDNSVRLYTSDGKKYKIKGKILLQGGSPCKNLSFAGNMEGLTTECKIEITTLEYYLDLKQKGFKFKGQSYLIWEYVRILRILKPEVFLLENVRMAKKWKDMFSQALGVEPLLLNSNLVSAQNRKRLYWTNIKNIEQPEDKGIFIKDILEAAVDEKYYLTNKQARGLKIQSRKHKRKGNGFTFNPINNFNTKSYTLTDVGKNRLTNNYLIVPENTKKGYITVKDGDCLLTSHQFLVYNHPRVRKVTPLECERLQTIPDNYTSIVSNSQRYKMLGKGWTADIISHIYAFFVTIQKVTP